MSFGSFFVKSSNHCSGSLRGEKSVTTAPRLWSDTKPGSTSPAEPCSRWNWMSKRLHFCLAGEEWQRLVSNTWLWVQLYASQTPEESAQVTGCHVCSQFEWYLNPHTYIRTYIHTYTYVMVFLFWLFQWLISIILRRVQLELQLF